MGNPPTKCALLSWPTAMSGGAGSAADGIGQAGPWPLPSEELWGRAGQGSRIQVSSSQKVIYNWEVVAVVLPFFKKWHQIPPKESTKEHKDQTETQSTMESEDSVTARIGNFGRWQVRKKTRQTKPIFFFRFSLGQVSCPYIQKASPRFISDFPISLQDGEGNAKLWIFVVYSLLSWNSYVAKFLWAK